MSEKEIEHVRMKREVGPMAAAMIILGAIIGSGIYVSPKGIVENAETAGFSMVMWCMAGIVAVCGALCYAELGLLIPKSGGEYPILFDTYGHIPGFIFAWTCTTIIRPASLAIFCVTFAEYALSITGGTCEDTSKPKKILAICAIWAVIFVNVYSMKLTQNITKIFGYIKIASLVFIVVLGLYGVGAKKGDMSLWSTANSFAVNGVTTLPSLDSIGLGLYHGLWSFDGWNQLNYVLEEVKEPEKNLLRAICSSLALISALYLMVNFFYFSILGVDGILNSNAVATDFAKAILPQISWMIPIMVACSCLGAALVQGMTAARIPYVASRQNQLPKCLSMIHIFYLTPAPAVILNGLIAALMVIPNDFNSLVNYFSFCMWIFHTSTCLAVVILRRLMPLDQYPRTFQVPIFIPYAMGIVGSYLVLVPFIQEFKKIGDPKASFDFGYSIVFAWILFGLFLYLMLKKYSGPRINKFVMDATKGLQQLMQVVPEE